MGSVRQEATGPWLIVEARAPDKIDGVSGWTVTRTRTFRSGNSEAVRLSKDVALGQGVELMIVRSGDVMTIYPAATSIPAMIKRLRALPAPPGIEQRDREEQSEWRGL